MEEKKAKKTKKARGFLSEFKTFATRGNVIDLAVGVIIGAAFGKITTSLVESIIMPFIALFTGAVDFNSMVIKLGPLFGEGDPAIISIGAFLTAVLDFVIIAFVVFLMMKVINKLRTKEAAPVPPPAPPTPSREELLLTEIRDLLSNR